MNKNTAILIFANSAQKDAERKSFVSDAIFKALNQQTLKTVQKSDLDYFHFSEKNQIGKNFGERFSNAIQSIFDKGFQNVITIGNDTPHLQTNHLKETAKKLASKDLVLGPSKDGGFYLMGIKKEHFSKKKFLKLPWQTSKLQKHITALVNCKNLKIEFLELLKDIDVKEDIKQIINSFKSLSGSVLTILKTYILSQKMFFSDALIHIKKTFFIPNFNKGSPLIFA